MADYPAELVRTRRLFDGSEVLIRPIRAEDAAMEQDEALKERVEFMKQGASYMRDETEPAASNP